jgi:hypothetical protein
VTNDKYALGKNPRLGMGNPYPYFGFKYKIYYSAIIYDAMPAIFLNIKNNPSFVL